MTIQEAIDWLEKIKAKHGQDSAVYFDCPVCEKSFTPTTVSTKAVHVKGVQV